MALNEISEPFDRLEKITRDWINCPGTISQVEAARAGMPKFTIRYDLIERTLREIDIEANSLEEAKRIVEEYRIEFDDGREVESIEWSISNVCEKGEP